ncbi:MAG: hypothetical protein HOC23_00620 [Halieaceae bacterium]|jgi:hypothetical protein|nr:hypothetical protein [Halieaceae bacterium]
MDRSQKSSQICQLLAYFCLLVLGGCAGTDTQTRTTTQYCAGIESLVKSYENGFRDVRGKTAVNGHLVDVWRTDVQLVGNNCELWQWGGNQVTYVCSKTFPNKELSQETYQRAKDVIETCLPEWGHLETTRKLGEGTKVLYQRDGQLPGVAVHTVATPRLFTSEWTTYVFVGDPSDQL